MKLILGLITLAAGILIVMQSEWLLKNFGRIGWFEKHLGSEGGTRLGYKLVGIALIFFGFLAITGLIDGFLGFALSPLIRGQI